MSVKERSLGGIEKRIREIFKKEQTEKVFLIRTCLRAQRFSLMLYHEVVSDDVGIRAQSFSYLTLFSILPILAGLFLLFGMMSQWGPIQTGFQDFIIKLLEPIPDDYRDTLLEFILSFKEQYVNQINQKSGSIGILALGVLIWIFAKVFFNIEDLMNRVWSVRTGRPWIERVQNFIITSVVLPLFAAISFSLPGILERWAGVRAGSVFTQVVPAVMSFVILSFMLRFFPNVRVKWKSAFCGALFSSFLFAVSNVFLKIYFQFGTDSAYGKVAVLPIVAFFIYVMWFIFILGAEVSYLVQNQGVFTGRKMPTTTLGEAQVILETLEIFHERFKKGGKPLSSSALSDYFNVSIFPVQRCIRYLLSHGILQESASPSSFHGPTYVLARDLEGVDQAKLVQDYLHIDELVQIFDSKPIFSEVLAKMHQARAIQNKE